MIRVRITGPAALDIDSILETSDRTFGNITAERYENLIAVGVEALRVNPHRVGVRSSVDAIPGVSWLHLRSVRNLTLPTDRIGTPRHILVFKADADVLTVLRVLHDAMDLSAHLS